MCPLSGSTVASAISTGYSVLPRRRATASSAASCRSESIVVSTRRPRCRPGRARTGPAARPRMVDEEVVVEGSFALRGMSAVTGPLGRSRSSTDHSRRARLPLVVVGADVALVQHGLEHGAVVAHRPLRGPRTATGWSAPSPRRPAWRLRRCRVLRRTCRSRSWPRPRCREAPEP